MHGINPTQPTKQLKFSTQPDPTQTNPTHRWTQPMSMSALFYWQYHYSIGLFSKFNSDVQIAKISVE